MKRIILLALLFISGACAADPCATNFSADGNLLTGHTYKTWAILPGTHMQDAFPKVLAFTAHDGFTILSANKDTGIISATQTTSNGKGRTIPLNVSFTEDGAGTRVSISFATSGGMFTSEDTIKDHFCSIIAAGSAVTNKATDANAEASNHKADSDKGQVQPSSNQTSQVNSEFVKDGMPCLNGICIGDDIATLSKISNWEPVTSFSPFGPSVLARNMKINEADFQTFSQGFGKGANSTEILRKAFPFFVAFSVKEFDSDGIPKLARLKGFCKPTELMGNFKSESGFDTRVTVTVLPESDPSHQTLRVYSIVRTYPPAFTLDQRKELAEKFKVNYAGVLDNLASGAYFLKHGGKYPSPYVYWQFDPAIPGTSLTLINQDMFAVRLNQDLFKQYPGCGKDISIN